jgi:osmotically-inducible protein OsmY
LAQEVAKQDPKVKNVYNEIEVSEPLALSARNYDSWLTTKVKTKLLTVKEVNAFQVKVVTSNQTVYLLGIIPNETANLAAEAAAQVDGVLKVVKAFEPAE